MMPPRLAAAWKALTGARRLFPGKSQPLAKSEQALMMEAMNPLRGLTLAQAQQIFDLARQGCYAQLHYLYDNIEKVDPTLFVCAERRESSLAELDWEVVRSDARKNPGAARLDADRQIAALQTAIADCSNLYDGIEWLATAFFRGFAHIRPVYSPDGKSLKSVETVDGWNFCYDRARRVWQWNPSAVMARAGEGNPDLADIPPGELCSLVRRRHINYPALAVYIRSALGERDWGRFLERYGIPPVTIIMPDLTAQADEQKFYEAAEKAALAANGALPFGSQVHYGTEARGVNPFEAFLNHQQQLTVLLATGGLLTSLAAPGTGTLAGNAHTETFATIVRRDSRHVAGAINRQICEPLLSRLFPGQPFLAEFRLKTEPDPTPDEVFDHAGKARAAGYLVDRADLEARTGYKLAADIATSGGELPVEGGRSMPFFGNRKLPCTLHPSPSTGGAAAQPPCKTPQLPCKIAANKETPEGTEKDAPALKRILEAFSADAAPVAAEVEKLLALPPEEQPAAAEALLKKLPNLFPDDPQIAAILAEEMAAAFAEALEKGIGDGEPVVENKNCPEDGGFIGKDGCTHRNHSARSREPETPSQRDRHGMADETRLAADPALNIPRAKSAMEEVMRKKNGFVERGAYRPETGWIRLDYGDPGDPANDYKGGHGLSHIAAKHPEDVRHLPEVLAKGTLHKHEQEGKIYVAHGSRFAVLAPLKKGGKKTVTSYEPDNADRVALIKQRPPVKRPGAH